jgi:hypothetical protein
MKVLVPGAGAGGGAGVQVSGRIGPCFALWAPNRDDPAPRIAFGDVSAESPRETQGPDVGPKMRRRSSLGTRTLETRRWS